MFNVYFFWNTFCNKSYFGVWCFRVWDVLMLLLAWRLSRAQLINQRTTAQLSCQIGNNNGKRKKGHRQDQMQRWDERWDENLLYILKSWSWMLIITREVVVMLGSNYGWLVATNPKSVLTANFNFRLFVLFWVFSPRQWPRFSIELIIWIFCSDTLWWLVSISPVLTVIFPKSVTAMLPFFPL